MAHFAGLVGPDAQIGAGFAAAKEHEAGGAVLIRVVPRVAFVHLAGKQASGACETPALSANRREGDAGAVGAVQNILVRAARE